MACRYDLLVIDLDGTLLDPGGDISPANRQAVRRARRAGVQVVIATGRALAESRAFLEWIEHDGYVVGAGGAVLNDAATGRTVDRTLMDPALVAHVADALVDHGHRVLLLKDPDVAGFDYLAVGEADLDPASQWWFATLPLNVRYVRDIGEDPHPTQTLRAAAVACASELAPLALRLIGELGDRSLIQHWSAVTETEKTGARTHVLEVFAPEVNKWSMIARHCRRQGIDPARVAAIGDGLNDVDLVREAALGIAMGNADPRVRAVADRITSDWTSDGVARAIENLLAGIW